MTAFRRAAFFAVALTLALLLCGCSNRAVVAAKATVETFYGAVQADDVALIDDNLAQNASPTFREHAVMAATAAQGGGAAQRAVRVVRIEPPKIDGGTAQVQVVFADGGADTVSLVREGERWKVLTSGRLQ